MDLLKKLYANDVKMTVSKDIVLPNIMVIRFENFIGNKLYCGKYFHDISLSDAANMDASPAINLCFEEFLHDLEGKSDVV